MQPDYILHVHQAPLKYHHLSPTPAPAPGPRAPLAQGTPGFGTAEQSPSGPYTPNTPGSVYNPQDYSPYQPSPSPSNSYVPTPSPSQGYQPSPSPRYLPPPWPPL